MFADKASHDLYNRLKNYTRKVPKLLRADEVTSWSVGNTYFDRNIFELTDIEVYVDCGSNHGHTIREFIEAVNGTYTHIYAYEPQKDLYEKLCKTFLKTHNILISNVVIGERNGRASIHKKPIYKEKIDTQFCCNPDGDYEMKSLDKLLLKRGTYAPTFIKFDIEGMEREAIIGATKLLQTYKPKLAIACYHRRDDIDKIPELLKKIQPEYSLYLRHYHKENPHSTILYAV